MSPMISLFITSFFGACNCTFAIAEVIRSRSVPGTRRRYVYATIQWTLAPFVAIQPLWMAMRGVPTWWWPIVTIANLYLIYCLYRDDDDNFWRRKRKQLKRLLSVRRMQLAGSRA